jgi:DNA-directed RNA polymerase specialized sigma24 family protein
MDPDDENPVVREQVELAIKPYRHLLPEEVVDGMGKMLALMLATHPVGVGLVARLSPETRVDLPLTADARQRDFEGFAQVNVVRKLFARMREKAKQQGDTQFIPPDTSMAALVAYLAYMRHDDLVWTAPEPEVRAAARLVTDGIMAALFVGLMQEVEARPDTTTAWGDAGRALADASPRAITVLARAMAKLPEQLQTLLLAYRACGWDADRLAKRQRIPARTVNARCDEAMARLGEALRAELASEAPAGPN